jgi:hypothetical protein
MTKPKSIKTDRELLQQALDALKHLCLHSAAIKGYDGEQVQTAIVALRARLAQPEPDYEAEFIKDWNEGKVRRVSDGKRMVLEREWQGLTDDEVMVLNRQSYDAQIGLLPLTFYRAIEAKLKEKNT